MADGRLEEVVGVRFSARGPVVWYRAGPLPALAGVWVVAERNGAAVGQVIVGRGQCLSFPNEPGALPRLIREATPAELPRARRGAGRALLGSLPDLRGFLNSAP